MANLMASSLGLNLPPRKSGQNAVSCLFFHNVSNIPLMDSFIMSSVSFIQVSMDVSSLRVDCSRSSLGRQLSHNNDPVYTGIFSL